MANINPISYTKSEIAKFTGDVRQLAGVQPLELVDGNERGTRIFEVYNAAGLCFQVVADRGMSIINLKFRGINLPYISPVGTPHPAYSEHENLNWLRTFPGGFGVPCGTGNVGKPCIDGDKSLGLHGRIGSIPATNVHCGGVWEGEKYKVFVEGTMVEAACFGENISITRRIWTYLDAPQLWIEDRVENHDFTAVPFMYLQHFNLGFPLVSPQSRLELPPHQTQGRDEIARAGLTSYSTFEEPVIGYDEQVFYHNLEEDSNGKVFARLFNPSFGINGLGVTFTYRKADYPILVQWKNMRAGMYVVGIEPANCHVEGRVREREYGTLQFLAPHEVRLLPIEVSFEG